MRGVSERQYIRTKDRIGMKFGKLTCLKELTRHGRGGANIKFLWRCDCGNEVEMWVSGLYRLTNPCCGCSRPQNIRKRQAECAVPVPPLEPDIGLFGVHKTLRQWGAICGVTGERIRQRVLLHGTEKALLFYVGAVEFLIGELHKRSEAGKGDEMETQENIARLMEIAKTAKPVVAGSFKSRYEPYDDIITELHGKGFSPAQMQRWFAEQEIKYPFTTIGKRLQKLGHEPLRARAVADHSA